MKILDGEALKNNIKASEVGLYKKRWCYDTLSNYVNSNQSKKTLCLYGLRRTGKTVLMQQVVSEIGDYDKTLWITCEEGDLNQNIRKYIRDYYDTHELKYLFIDEATLAKGFVSGSAYLANDFSSCGVRVLITGADSLGFNFAARDAMFDRISFLQTSYISFAEYNYLLGKSLDDYIRYGGTLTDGKKLYNHDMVNYSAIELPSI